MSQSVESLSPVDRLNCIGRPFGYDLAAALNFHAPLRLTNEQRAIAENMKARINELSKSDSAFDRTSLEEIGDHYRKNDLWALREEHQSLRVSRDIVGWLGRASCRSIAQFAVWNTERHDLLQASYKRDHQYMIEDTLGKIERLIDLGLFPKRARQSIEQAIGAYGVVRAMDSFEAGARQADGICTPEIITIANNYMLPDIMEGISPDMQGVYFHEYLHGAGMQSASGFMEGIATNGVHRWLEESFVEHATQVARDEFQPDATVVHPAKRREIGAGSVYYQERQILASLTSDNLAGIPIDLLATAFFSSRDSRERHEVERRLNTFFETILPGSEEQGIDTFSQLYEESRHDIERAHLFSKLIGTIEESARYSLSHTESSETLSEAQQYFTIDELINCSTN